MKKNLIPIWMTKDLKNLEIHQMLIDMLAWNTDGSIQQIYEYIKELEGE